MSTLSTLAVREAVLPPLLNSASPVLAFTTYPWNECSRGSWDADSIEQVRSLAAATCFAGTSRVGVGVGLGAGDAVRTTAVGTASGTPNASPAPQLAATSPRNAAPPMLPATILRTRPV